MTFRRCRRQPILKFMVRTLVAAWSFTVVAPALGCTTLCILDAGRIVLGKNYDWYVSEGVLLVNKRGVARTAYVSGDPAARWTSAYGSVTFNQYGRDQPAGGMNEAGLVVEILWQNGSLYPAADARPAVGGGTGWIQYQLDTAANVDEVVASDRQIRIPRSGSTVHYFVADRSGAIAAIEFRDGRMVAHRGSALPAPALANDFYAESLAEYRSLESAGKLAPETFGSQSRFARAAKRALDYRPGGDPVQYAFDTLHEVAQGKQAIAPAPPAHVTQWSYVYEIDRLRLHFRSRAQPAVKTLSLPEIDFSCGTPVLHADIHLAEGGDVRARLKPYSRDANAALIKATWSQTPMLKLVPAQEIERVAAHPEKSICRKR